MTLCNKLKSQRKMLGLTITEVAERVGVAKSTVHKWENGNIKNMGCDKIKLLSQILNIPILDFIFTEDNNKVVNELSEYENKMICDYKKLSLKSQETVDMVFTVLLSSDDELMNKARNVLYDITEVLNE